MRSQKTVEKNENGFRAFRRTRKRRLRIHRKAGSRRNVRRKITASAVLLSILFMAFPFTQVTQVGLAQPKIDAPAELPQQDIDEINALAAFNIGKPYQPPQPAPSRPGVVVAQQINVDPNPSPQTAAALAVRDMLPLVREAAARKLQYYSGGPKTSPTPLPPPYSRKGYRGAASRVAVISATRICEQAEGAGNCELVGGLAYPKCKPGFTASGEMCNPIFNPAPNSALPSAEAISAELRQAASDPAEKLKLAPFMLQVAWEALATNNPTPQQQAFYKYFQYYAGWQNQQVTQWTLVQWCKYKKNFPRSPLSVVIGNGPTSAGFKPAPKPMSIGPNGYLAMDQFLTPAIVTDLYRRDPTVQIDNLATTGQPLDYVLTSLGFTGPSAAAVMTSMLGELPDGWPGSKLPLAIKVQNTLKNSSTTAARTAITIGIQVLDKLIGEVVGLAISEIGAPVAIIALALEILIKHILAEVETPKFEAELIKGSKEVQPADIRGLIHTSKPGYGDGLKIGVMAHLIKMMIVDPADGTPFGPTQFVVLDPFQQALGGTKSNPNDVCGRLDAEGLLQ